MSGRVELKPCYRCGMDSGDRRVTVYEPARFCVVCGFCGARTHLFRQQSQATREWNDLYEAVRKQKAKEKQPARGGSRLHEEI